MLYTVSNGKYTAQVDSTGAQLVSLKGPDGFEYIWTGDPAYWKGHAPVLFPIVGGLRDNKALLDGQWVEMGRHGFARHQEFSPAEQGEGVLSLKLTPNEETKKCYPFDFAFTVTYALTGTGYTTTFTVENTGDRPMPFVVGGHPGFNVPVDEKAAFEDYVIRFEKEETQRCPVIQLDTCLLDPTQTAFEMTSQRDIPLQHSLFYQDALVFEGLNSSTVALVNPSTGKGVEMDFSQFPLLGIWSCVNDGPYVCLEPWTGCATQTTEGDKFEEKKGMELLPAGEKRSYSFQVRFL
jgi:galactose mutarotase-like enzyme